MGKKIAIGCDHGGFEMKNELVDFLKEMGCEVGDFGLIEKAPIDYPIIAEKVATAVSSGEYELGILVCGTGIGMSLAANKVKGIRAAVCSESYSAALTRRHNNANIIAFGARVVGVATAEAIVDAFLEAEFEGGRHAARVDLITAIEEGKL